MHRPFGRVLAHLFTAAALIAPGLGSAQGFQPTKPVRIVVPFGPGGSTDLIARSIAEKLTKSLAQPVVVENKGGASGLIGIGDVARAPADGYTLLVTNTALLQTAILNTSAGYDPRTSFTPVAQLTLSPLVFSVNPAVPAKTIQEFAALAKAKPAAYSYGNAGTGQTLHLMDEQLNRSAGLKLAHVPYKGEAPFINDMVGGHVQAGFSSVAVAVPHIKAGNLRALVVLNPTRLAALPDVPTAKEADLEGFDLMSWFGLFAPAGTPPAIVNALHEEVAAIMKMPDVRKRLDDLALSPVEGVTQQGFARIVATDYDAWAKLMREARITPQ